VLSRRVAVLLAAAGMAALMLALAGTAWATGGGGGGAPTVVRTVPADGATNVPLDANIKVKFSEAMKAKSINTNTFYIPEPPTCSTCLQTTTTSFPPIPATVRYNAGSKTAVLDPTEPLRPNTTYGVVVEGTGDGDMKAVKDKGGTPMATDYVFFFTTIDCNVC
jgi:hypothetical protein